MTPSLPKPVLSPVNDSQRVWITSLTSAFASIIHGISCRAATQTREKQTGPMEQARPPTTMPSTTSVSMDILLASTFVKSFEDFKIFSKFSSQPLFLKIEHQVYSCQFLLVLFIRKDVIIFLALSIASCFAVCAW